MLKYVHARSGVDCILQCLLQDQSCRSVNFRKRPAANAEYENCELLYDVESESPELLHENDIYDYYILLQPNRVSISRTSQLIRYYFKTRKVGANVCSYVTRTAVD